MGYKNGSRIFVGISHSAVFALLVYQNVEAGSCGAAIKRAIFGPSSEEIAAAGPYMALGDSANEASHLKHAAYQVEMKIHDRMLRPSKIGLAAFGSAIVLQSFDKAPDEALILAGSGLSDTLRFFGAWPMHLISHRFAESRIGRFGSTLVAGAGVGAAYGHGAGEMPGLKEYAVRGLFVAAPLAAWNFVRETQYRFRLLDEAVAETQRERARIEATAAADESRRAAVADKLPTRRENR